MKTSFRITTDIAQPGCFAALALGPALFKAGPRHMCNLSMSAFNQKLKPDLLKSHTSHILVVKSHCCEFFFKGSVEEEFSLEGIARVRANYFSIQGHQSRFG